MIPVSIPKPLCFYIEFPFSPKSPPIGTLKDVLGTSLPDESSASYLENGIYLIVSGGAYDVMQPEKWISIGKCTGIQTDGAWFWSPLLSYYVRNFGLPLPHEFLVHKSSCKVELVLSDIERGQLLAAIVDKYYPGWMKGK